MAVNVLADALTIHLWYRDKNKENDHYNPKPKEDGA
jgi:hypothetical protein